MHIILTIKNIQNFFTYLLSLTYNFPIHHIHMLYSYIFYCKRLKPMHCTGKSTSLHTYFTSYRSLVCLTACPRFEKAKSGYGSYHIKA